jgi:hypothetical protein
MTPLANSQKPNALANYRVAVPGIKSFLRFLEKIFGVRDRDAALARRWNVGEQTRAPPHRS